MRIALFSLIASCGLLLAGPASAVSLWYGDVHTSSLLGNVHTEIQLPTAPSSISSLLAGTSLDVLGTGLGSGAVSSGSPIAVTHTFAPNDVVVNAIQSASLVVSVIDDLDLSSEEVRISIGSDVIGGGSGVMLAGLFGGDVAAFVQGAGDSINVTIAAVRGDFKVLFSALSVEFDATLGAAAPAPSTPAIPEPSAALVFAAGLAIASRRRLR